MGLSVYSDEHFMRKALEEALYAKEEEEIPVGAVIVCNNKIIARAHNQTERLKDSTAHAEMLVLTSGFNYFGSKYLPNCTLYVTLEPCVMCAGACFWSQLERVVFGAYDPLRGFTKTSNSILHPKTTILGGVLEKESKALLDNFFKGLRS